MPELWQPIEGYEGLYEVSSEGRVRSFARNRERVLKQNTNKYPCVVLCANGVRRTFTVHRLVAKAFVRGNHNLTVNHKDGDKKNNRADNLEWISHSDQQKHAIQARLRSRAWGRALRNGPNPEQWAEMYLKYLDGQKQRDIAINYGVSQSYVSTAIKRYLRSL